MKWRYVVVAGLIVGCTPGLEKVSEDGGSDGGLFRDSDAESSSGPDPDSTGDMGGDGSANDDAGNDGGNDGEGGPVECLDGPSGGGPGFCENAVDCDGVTYEVDCDEDSNVCTCSVDGQVEASLAYDDGFCGYDTLRKCGAPIPSQNPDCNADVIATGGGSDFCEIELTCDDDQYRVRCDTGGDCRCIVNGEDGGTVAGSDCDGELELLKACGAPLAE